MDLLLEADEPLNAGAREKLGIVRTAAGDMARIVERMREFCRLGKQTEPLQSMDLNRLVRQVMEHNPARRAAPVQRGATCRRATATLSSPQFSMMHGWDRSRVHISMSRRITACC